MRRPGSYTHLSLLWGALPLAAAFLLRMPLTALAANVCEGLGLSNFAISFRQLLQALEGGATSADSRLGYYLTALEGFERGEGIEKRKDNFAEEIAAQMAAKKLSLIHI